MRGRCYILVEELRISDLVGKVARAGKRPVHGKLEIL
jgi:hypothetical protein